MDDEMRAYLDRIEQKVDQVSQRLDLVDQRFDQIRGEMNDGHERLLNKLASLEHDFLNTKGFLISDAVVAGRRWLDLDERTTRLERKP